MNRSRYHILLVALILAIWAGLPAHASREFERVERLRLQAGLPGFTHDEQLAAAASRHAAYLDRHREPGVAAHGLSAHRQEQGLDGFSGAMPADRALAAGYPHREVLENVSMGYADAESALSGLMSAIYHRLTFLDFEADRIGVAVGERSRVFLLGRSDIAALCRSPPRQALLRQAVDCLGQAMTREYYEGLCANLPDQARFKSSHPIGCPDGTLLDAGYMAAVCARPPAAARFRGHGRYYAPCEDNTRVDADWFNRLCSRPPAVAAYPFSGSYYEICDEPLRVHAEWLEAECAALPATALYTDSGRYRRPCAHDSDIRAEFLEGLDRARQQSLPEVVVWPPDGAGSVPPAFFIEEPDPLPDLEVSGYPLSIQFNPAKSRQIDLRAFRLYRLDGDTREPVEQVRLLDQANDPNQLLSAHEFALFPLRRLAWGARYAALVEAELDGRVRQYEWQFQTAGQGMPLLTAAQPQQRFLVRSGVEYLLYLPPRDGRAYTVLQSRTEHLCGNSVTLEVVDPNTLRLQVKLRYCDPVKVQFDEGRRVELLAQGCPD
jgi:hypothetical protein